MNDLERQKIENENKIYQQDRRIRQLLADFLHRLEDLPLERQVDELEDLIRAEKKIAINSLIEFVGSEEFRSIVSGDK